MLAGSIQMSPTDFSFHAKALESRMDAAAEALLRVRDEVVAALDRQVVEIQQLHRALASPPPPMSVVRDLEEQSAAALVEPSVTHSAVADLPAAFEKAPFPGSVSDAGISPTVLSATVASPENMAPQFASFLPTMAASTSSIAAAPAASPPSPISSPHSGVLARIVAQAPANTFLAAVNDEETLPAEPSLDPFLERATLEELNDALASAFAMVSSRSNR